MHPQNETSIANIPSDLLLLIIDYLDSPTLMNCRQVSTRWFQVIEANRFLFNYFYLPRDDRRCTIRMLDFFSSKSRNTMRAFDLTQGTSLNSIEPPVKEWQKFGSEMIAKNILDILSRSKLTLRFWSHCSKSWDSQNTMAFIRGSGQFNNLRSFRNLIEGESFSKISVKIRNAERVIHDRINDSDIVNQDSSSLIEFIDTNPDSPSSSSVDLVIDSRRTLIHLKYHPLLLTLYSETFENLRLFQYLDFNRSLSEALGWKFPKLKTLILFLTCSSHHLIDPGFKGVTFFKELWLTRDMEEYLKIPGTYLIEDALERFERLHPNLIHFRIDVGINFISEEVMRMVRARQNAASKGLKVEGIPMKAIEKVTLDLTKLDEALLEELKELVPEVVDARTASNEIIVDC